MLQVLNMNARIPLRGLISEYNAVEPALGPGWRPLLFNRVLVKLRYREDVVVGLDNAPDAFIGLLQGKNFGKLLVRVSDAPTK